MSPLSPLLASTAARGPDGTGAYPDDQERLVTRVTGRSRRPRSLTPSPAGWSAYAFGR